MSEIHTAKLRIMEAVPYVRKVGSKGLNYTFASERELIAKIRPALIANNVSVAPIKSELVSSGTVKTKAGDAQNYVISVTYRFSVQAEFDSYEDVQVLSQAADSYDKAIAKAMTGAYKYALRQWLCIETGDDPDYIVPMSDESLSPNGVSALNAIESASTREEIDAIARRVAGSHSLADSERSHLIERANARRDSFPTLEQEE